jgi:hypothetical protein
MHSVPRRTAATTTSVETDDTAFVTSNEGFILFAGNGLNTVCSLKKKAFAPGSAYTAADGGPILGTIDVTTGFITTMVTGLSGPGGLAFVDTSKHDGDDSREEDGNSCRDRNWDSR